MTFDVMLGVPIDSSGAFVGCERLPAALRAAGIAEATARRPRQPPGDDRRPGTRPGDGVSGSGRFDEHPPRARRACRRHRPLVLGGCCTLLLGVARSRRSRLLLGSASRRSSPRRDPPSSPSASSLGPADEEEAAANGSPDPRAFAPGMPIVDHRRAPARPGAPRAAGARPARDGPFWLHLDLDVLSAASCPRSTTRRTTG